MLFSHTLAWYSALMLYTCTGPVESESGSGNSTLCPTWFYYSNTTEQCECGEQFQDRISCKQHSRAAYIANGFCASTSRQEGLYYAGLCPFRHTENNTNRLFSRLPSDPDMLDDAMCGPYNRKGLLCGECIDGYGPAVYSRDMKCTKCSTVYVVAYLVIELVPVTLFFLFLAVFHLNITSGPLLGYIIFCQAFVLSIQSNLDSYNYILSHTSATRRALLRSSVALSEVWSLQFLWSMVPSFCFSESLTEIDLQMLGLVKPTLAIVLLVFTYILTQLYANHCRVLRIMWKPFGIVLNKVNIVPQTSDASFHAFGTFIFLSASTLAYNIYSLFNTVPVYQSINGSVYKTITHSSSHHTSVAYAFVAIVIFVVLVLTPSLLLCVYPTRLYRNLKQALSPRKQLAIAGFAEAFNKCFKDGSNGTRDYRATAGVVLLTSSLIRPLGALAIRENLGSQFLTGAIFIFLSFVVSYVRPCKLTMADLSLSYHTTLLGIFSIAAGLWRHDLNTGTDALEITFIAPPIISHLLVYLWAVYVLIQRVAREFGYNFKLTKALGALLKAAKRPFHRRRRGYEELVDTS